MTTTSIDLYKALKPKLGEEAARMVADAIPPCDLFATRDDVLTLKSDVADIKTAIAELEARLSNRLLTFFVPLWLGVYGTILALILKK